MLESVPKVFDLPEVFTDMNSSKRQAWMWTLGVVLALASIPAALTGAPKAAAPASPQLPPGAERAAKAIDRSSLEAPIRFLADDLLEGRAPASRGDETAQLYRASTLQFLGYQPALPYGEWQQRFELVGVKSEMPKTWAFKAGGQNLDLKWWDDYIGAS